MRRLRAAGSTVLLLGLAACSHSGHTPSTPTSSAPASPTGSARQGANLVDPNTYGQSISEAKTLLNTRGKGNSSLSVPGEGKSGDFVVAVSCLGKGPLKVTDKSGRLLLRIATCAANPEAIYNSRGALRPADSNLQLTTDAAVEWRVAALQAPHE